MSRSSTPLNTAPFDYLQDLATRAFWGTVSLKFENDVVVHLRKEENIKPSDLPGTPRTNATTSKS
jgi:hypothetical protein